MVRIIDYKINTGECNMNFDKEILDEAIKMQSTEPILRFYGWSPACVSLGRNQSDTNINKEYCRQNNIDIVRRPTGGKGLLHDKEITYSFVCAANTINGGESIIKSYKEISGALIDGFKTLNINLTIGGKPQKELSHDYCMLLSTGADLCFNNKKLIGSAQYRKQGYILQHGSILLDYDKNKLEKIFNETTSKNCITDIKEINNSLSPEEIITALKQSFMNKFSYL